MTTREFQESDLSDLLDDAEEIGSQPWRHGRKVHYLFQADGAHWAVWLDMHHSEGLQTYGPVIATKMQQVVKTVTAWEPMP